MEERSWMEHVGRAAESLLDTAYALLSALPCGTGAAHVELNGRTYEVVKLLGEGGFSLVYLVRDPASGQQFALKKIRCQYGEASVRDALAEVDAMNRFRGPNVIRACDTAVVRDDARASVLGNVPTHDEESGQGRVVYILLPYYANGNLQDAINAHDIHATHFDERTLLHLFLGACRGVQTMHHYVPPRTGDERTATATAPQGESAALLFDAESDAAYPPAPPMRVANAQEAVDAAAREANIMIADDRRTAVLMDFGSTLKARIPIQSRKEAVAHQDLAAERSSMPYRAPELFDVKTDVVLDEKVDIWALGCTLYAMAYLHSPFETASTTEQGGSLALALLGRSARRDPVVLADESGKAPLD
ncbi:hypothetical protein CBS9595_000943 [Malassezia furfur]|nr:hypothetical protein CBS9595_000943 [Malassezia furfur]